jgi:hypothetical protein
MLLTTGAPYFRIQEALVSYGTCLRLSSYEATTVKMEEPGLPDGTRGVPTPIVPCG